MFRFVTLFCAFMAVIPCLVNAMSAEQQLKIKEHIEPMGIKCIQIHPINEDDIMKLKDKQLPSGPNAPCFVACVMREMSVLDGNGMIQKENALDMLKKVFEDDDERKVVEDFIHACIHVNNAPVTDGEKGCDRAMLAFKCLHETATEFGFI